MHFYYRIECRRVSRLPVFIPHNLIAYAYCHMEERWCCTRISRTAIDVNTLEAMSTLRQALQDAPLVPACDGLNLLYDVLIRTVPMQNVPQRQDRVFLHVYTPALSTAPSSENGRRTRIAVVDDTQVHDHGYAAALAYTVLHAPVI